MNSQDDFNIDTVYPRRSCCGATNPVCRSDARRVGDFRGCDSCGHSKGCHTMNR